MFVPGRILFWLLAFLYAAGKEISPDIYSKIFEVNGLLWQIIATEVQNLELPEGSRLVDLGAGPGEPSATIGRMLPNLKLTVTDKQEAMLEKAKQRTKKLNNIEKYQVVDMDDLSVFEDASFDVVTAVFSLMFVTDAQKTLHEIARIIKPDGTAIIAVWKNMPMYTLAREAVEETYTAHGGLGTDAPPFEINPLSLSPTDHNTHGAVEEHLFNTGLRLEHQREISYAFHFGDFAETCEASMIFTAAILPKMAADLGAKQSDLERDYCAAMKRKMQAKPFWKMADGDVKIGDGHAMIYDLKKGFDHDGEL